MKKLTALFLAVVMVLSVASVALAETPPVAPTTPVPVVLKLKAPAPKALVGKTEAVLVGSLVTSEAVPAPVADAAITVYRHVTRHGRGQWVAAGTAVTAADGTFSVAVPLVNHGQYRAVFAGSEAYGKKASRVVVTNVPKTRTRR